MTTFYILHKTHRVILYILPMRNILLHIRGYLARSVAFGAQNTDLTPEREKHVPCRLYAKHPDFLHKM